MFFNEATSIFGFGVSTNFDSDGSPFTFRDEWEAIILTDQDWDDGQQIGDGNSSPSTSDIGTFVSLFGSDDEGVNLYYNVVGLNITGDDDDDIPVDLEDLNPDDLQFLFGVEPSSEFVAFTEEGIIIDQSLQVVVPAPSAMLLMGSGLFGFVGWRWRKGRLA